MAQTVEDALREAELYSDDVLYRMVKLPANAVTAAAGVLAEISQPFSALIVDKDEVTLILADEDFTLFSNRLPESSESAASYRLITLDVPLEAALIGFMARISAALAEANISIMPFAAFSRDHLLVPAEMFDLAITTLDKLRRESKLR